MRRRGFLAAIAAAAVSLGPGAPARAAADGVFAGRVVDPGGRPAADVVVSVWSRIADRWYPTANGGTDAAGRYRVRALPGEHRVMLQRVNYVQYAPQALKLPAARSYHLDAGAEIAVDAALLPPARLTGSLRDAAGAPVPLTRVLLNAEEPAVAEALTDAAGYFDFGPTSPGTYTVLFLLPDGRRQYWPGTFDPAEARRVDLDLGGAGHLDETVADSGQQVRSIAARASRSGRVTLSRQ